MPELADELLQIDADELVVAFRARALEMACSARDDLTIHLPADAVVPGLADGDVSYPWLLAEIRIIASRLLPNGAGLARQPVWWKLTVLNHRGEVLVCEEHQL